MLRFYSTLEKWKKLSKNPFFFSVWSWNLDLYWSGDRYACNNGEKLRWKYFDRPSDLTSFVYILADAFSLRQFTSKVTLKKVERKLLREEKIQTLFTPVRLKNLQWEIFAPENVYKGKWRNLSLSLFTKKITYNKYELISDFLCKLPEN